MQQGRILVNPELLCSCTQSSCAAILYIERGCMHSGGNGAERSINGNQQMCLQASCAAALQWVVLTACCARRGRCPMNEGCCVGWQVKRMRVDIETCSTLSAGQTVCDIWGQSPLVPNATVALVRCPNRPPLSNHCKRPSTHLMGCISSCAPPSLGDSSSWQVALPSTCLGLIRVSAGLLACRKQTSASFGRR